MISLVMMVLVERPVKILSSVIIRFQRFYCLFEVRLLLVKLSWSVRGSFVGFVYVVDKFKVKCQ